jgi:hypothetical protein
MPVRDEHMNFHFRMFFGKQDIVFKMFGVRKDGHCDLPKKLALMYKSGFSVNCVEKYSAIVFLKVFDVQ